MSGEEEAAAPAAGEGGGGLIMTPTTAMAAGAAILGLTIAFFVLSSNKSSSKSKSKSGGGGFSEEELASLSTFNKSKGKNGAASSAKKPKKSSSSKKTKKAPGVAATAEPVVAVAVVEPEPVPPPAAIIAGKENEAVPATNGSGKKKKKKKKATAAVVVEPEPEPEPEPVLVTPEPEPAFVEPETGKKKKKKKKAAAAVVVVPEPEPEPEPDLEPEPVVVDPESGKKKKKKKKKKADGSADGNNNNVNGTSPYFETPPIEEQWEMVSKNKGMKFVAASFSSPPSALGGGAMGADGAAAAAVAAADDPNKTIEFTMSLLDPALIIGPQGSTIRNLEASTGCKFDINKDADTWAGPSVKITGTANQCAMAQALIQDILDDETARRARQVSEALQFDSNSVKAIIGKGGATIQDIEKRTGAKVDVNVANGTCTVSGEADQVEKAVTMCRNAVYGESQYSITLEKRSAVNLVYGKNFETIRQLQDASGAKLDLDRTVTPAVIKLSGSTESVEKAKVLVQNLLNLNKGVEFAVSKNSIGAIYGKAGSNIRAIQDRTNTFIEIEDSASTNGSANGGAGDSICYIMGEEKNVVEARRLIQMAVDGETELKPGEVKHVLELGPGAPAVIGRGGSKVAELEKRHAVKIKVHSGTTLCQVIGMAAAAAAAKDEIESIIKPYMEAVEMAKLAEQQVEKGDSAWTGGVDAALEGW